MTRRWVLVALLLALCAAPASSAQDLPRLETAGALDPSAAPASIRALLPKNGLRVALRGKATAELWLCSAIPEATGDLGKLGVVYPFLPEGTLVGVVRFNERWLDYRGKPVAPGTYTLRYAIQPTDGNHSGVSDFRDYLVLVPAAADPGEQVVQDSKALLALGRKGSGTNHPAVLSLVPVPKEAKLPSVVAGARDTITLYAAAGQRPLALIVSGKLATEGN